MAQPPRSIKKAVKYNLFSGQWESTEDRKMALYILQNGKKWS